MTVARLRMYAAVGVVFAGFLTFIVCGFTKHYVAGIAGFLVSLVLCAVVRPSWQDERDEKEKMQWEE